MLRQDIAVVAIWKAVEHTRKSLMLLFDKNKAFTSAKFYAQRLLGIRKEVDFSSSSLATRQVMAGNEEILLASRQSAPISSEKSVLVSQRTEFRSFIETATSDGWYMLEVFGTLHTIGANLTLRGLLPGHDEEVWSELAHVQMGSHRETKRLVHLDGDVEEICILIDANVEFESAPSIVLIRVTEAFAADRMSKKIHYASSKSGTVLLDSDEKSTNRVINIEPLYRDYQALMERHVNPVTYDDWLARKNTTDCPSHRPGPSDIGSDTYRQQSGYQALVPEVDSSGAIEYEATIDVGRAELTGFARSGKTAVKSGLMANPSLTLFLVDSLDSVEGVNAVLAAIGRLLDKVQIELTLVVPDTFKDTRFQELSQQSLSLVELVYFDPGADCSVLDAQFDEHSSDLQVFVCGSNVILGLDCLLQLYTAIRANPGVAMVYTDNDCIDEFGRRSHPVFKPEWNPELLRNGNYIGSVIILARQIYKATGGWQHRFEDSAMYDLLLRAGEQMAPAAIMRLPEVLWHTRISDLRETLFFARGKRDAEVLHDFLDGASHANEKVTVPASRDNKFNIRTGLIKYSLKIDRQLDGALPQVEILIPSKNKVDLLESCINSILRKTSYVSYSITIIDNGSEDIETLEYYHELQKQSVIKLLHHPGEFNYSALNNFAVSQSEADVLVLLNNDTEVISPGWLDEMVLHAMQDDVGCVGAKLYYTNNRIQHGGVIVGLKGMAGHAHRFLPGSSDGYCGRLKLSQNVSAVTAACLAVRRDVYQQVGGLDEHNLKVAYNDVDFCLKVLQAGFRNVWTPYAELYHHESVSRGSEDTAQKKQRFQQEFHFMLKNWATDSWEDAAYNPNLAKDIEDFSLGS